MQKQYLEVLSRKGVLKNFSKFTGKHPYQSCNCIKKDTLAQVSSCEFWEISKNIYFHRTPPLAASGTVNEYTVSWGLF